MENEDQSATEEAAPVEAAPADASVALTAEEATDVTDHINRMAVAPNDACPVCGSSQNFVAPTLYRVEAHREAPAAQIQYQPLYSTVCLNCGFVRFFNQYVVKERIAEQKAPKPEGANGS